MTIAELLLVAVAVYVALHVLMWAYGALTAPRRAEQLVKEILARVTAPDYVPPPKQSDLILLIDVAGLSVTRTGASASPLYFIPWAEVDRVVAFKRDCYVTDCICMEFVRANGMAIEVNEEMDGWEGLTTALPKYLLGSKELSEWFSPVSFPAFATNEVVLFDRDSAASMARGGSS